LEEAWGEENILLATYIYGGSVVHKRIACHYSEDARNGTRHWSERQIYIWVIYLMNEGMRPTTCYLANMMFDLSLSLMGSVLIPISY
jgi:hypothetical protein